MHRRFFALLTLLAPLALASCLFPPPEPAPQAEEGSIFNRPPRYGQDGTETPPPYPPPPPPGGQIPGDPSPDQRGYDWQRYKKEMGITDPPAAPGAAQGQTAGAPAPPTGATQGPASGGAASSTQAPPPPTQTTPPPSTGGSSQTQQKEPAATASSDDVPYGIPVPGKDGMLFSPYNKDAGYIDITTRGPDGSVTVLPPGTKIKDPFSGKPILVP